MHKSALAASLIVFLFISAPPVLAQEEVVPEEFTELHALIPDKCFSATLSVVTPGSVDIGIESGYSSTTWQNKACIASTRSFHGRTASDTFTVTVTAPAGMRIARIAYQQAGTGTWNGAPTGRRVTAPPGSATISVTDAVISVEYEPQVAVP